MTDRFTGCSCGTCIEARDAAFRFFEQNTKNEKCGVWNLMVAASYYEAAKSYFGSKLVRDGLPQHLVMRGITEVEHEMWRNAPENGALMHLLEGIFGAKSTGEIVHVVMDDPPKGH